MEYTSSQLQTILDAIPVTAVIYQVDGSRFKPLLYSKDAPSFSGLTEREYLELYGQDTTPAVAEKDLPALSAVIASVLNGEGDREATYRTFHKTKGFVWLHVHLRLLGTCEGLPVMLGVYANVTDEITEPEILLNNTSQKIYVIERGTFDLLFANSVARADKQSGPRLGQTCYQYIRGCETPCGNCIVSQLKDERPLETEWFDETRNRTYKVKAVPLTFLGKSAYAFFIDDLTSHIKLEQVLAGEREKYRAATEGASLMVYEYDITTHSIDLPPYSAKLFGVSEHVENVPEAILHCFQDKDHDRVRAFFAKVDNGEQTVTGEFLMKEIGGLERRLRYTFTPVFDKGGRPVRAYAVAEDVTAARKQEEEYKTFLKNLLTKKSENEIGSFHLNLTRNICGEGVSGTDYIMRFRDLGTVDGLIETSGGIIAYPEELAYYREHFGREALLRAFENGCSEVSYVFRDYYEDGLIHWTKTIVNMMRNPMSGDVEGVIYSFDVSDAAKEKLVVERLTHDEFDFIAIIDLDDQTIEFRNIRAAAQFEAPAAGTDYRQYTELCLKEAVEPEELAEALSSASLENITAQLDQADTCSFAFTRRGRDGSSCRKQLRYSYLDDDRKHILLIQTDITDIFAREQRQQHELKNALDQARQASAAKSEFLSRISHDIRTPMNGIIGMTYIAKEQDNPPKTEKCLDNIETSSKFLLGLVNDVLDMSKAESGKIELHPEPYLMTDFNDYLDSVIRPLYEAKKQTFAVETHHVQRVIPIVDILRFNQIIFNILSNAVKYTPEGGKITFYINNELIPGHRERVTTIISDDGIGMSREFQKRLFDPFTQGERSDTAQNRGSGLGLAIVKKLVDLMGGSISVESEPGKGSVFTIVIDFDYLEEDQTRWQENKERASASDLSLAGRRILLCEDHPMNQEIVKSLLEEKQALVDIAENGLAGLRRFQEAPPWFYDAILMDIRMPVMDGYEATKKLRGLERRDASCVPIIAMTADAFADDVRKCLEAGMNGHIAKPIDPGLMIKLLNEKMAKRK